MPTITLSCYEIGIRPMNEKNTFRQLNDFNNGNDLFDFLKNYIPNWRYEANSEKVHQSNSEENPENTEHKIISDDLLKKVLRLKSDSLKFNGRNISGIIETGEYGYEAPIVDRITGELLYTKSKDGAAMLPFYFLLSVPKNAERGILMLQGFKQFGVFSIFSKTIKTEFQEKNNGFYFHIAPLVSTELIERFMQSGIISKISFKNTKNNQEAASLFSNVEGFDPKDFYTEVNLIAKRGKKLPFLAKFRNATENTIPALVPIQNYDYNKISLSITLNGHKRTLDLFILLNYFLSFTE